MKRKLEPSQREIVFQGKMTPEAVISFYFSKSSNDRLFTDSMHPDRLNDIFDEILTKKSISVYWRDKIVNWKKEKGYVQ